MYPDITYLTFGLSQFAFQSSKDSLNFPQSLLFGQVLHSSLEVSVQAVQQELLRKHTVHVYSSTFIQQFIFKHLIFHASFLTTGKMKTFC